MQGGATKSTTTVHAEFAALVPAARSDTASSLRLLCICGQAGNG